MRLSIASPHSGLHVGNVWEFDSVLNEMHAPRVGNSMVGNLAFNIYSK